MLFHVSLTGLASVVRRIMTVPARRMGMVGSLFVLSALVMFSCFGVMARSVSMVFCGLFVVLGCLLRHGVGFPCCGL